MKTMRKLAVIFTIFSIIAVIFTIAVIGGPWYTVAIVCAAAGLTNLLSKEES